MMERYIDHALSLEAAETLRTTSNPKKKRTPSPKVKHVTTWDLAAGMLRALCRAEVYKELVVESGWSPEEYESWLRQTLKGQLLSPRPTPDPTRFLSRIVSETAFSKVRS
ncbi:MAG: hypothetical protein M3151_00460 [Actinomycetota bacterium]|nr:hypothetical protein [Actinomycetota bacterium]